MSLLNWLGLGKTAMSPEQLGANCAYGALHQWPKRLVENIETLGKPQHRERFEAELATYFCFTLMAPVLKSPKLTKDKQCKRRFLEGVHQEATKLLENHGWRKTTFTQWENIRNKRYAQYDGMVDDVLSGEGEKFGAAFLRNVGLPPNETTAMAVTGAFRIVYTGFRQSLEKLDLKP